MAYIELALNGGYKSVHKTVTVTMDYARPGPYHTGRQYVLVRDSEELKELRDDSTALSKLEMLLQEGRFTNIDGQEAHLLQSFLSELKNLETKVPEFSSEVHEIGK
ncbi:MAG: hypothetical protein Q9218_004015 [Villophora microphyllina]